MNLQNRTGTQTAVLALLIAVAAPHNGAAAPRPQTVFHREQTAAPAALLAQDAGEGQAWAGKIAPALLARAASTAGNVDFLIAFHQPEAVGPHTGFPGAPARLRWIAETGDGIERDYTSAGVQILQRYSHLATVYASAPASALPLLAADPRVEAIAVNHKVHKLDTEGRALMHVSAIQPPYNGAGVGIAILDTGVDWTHPELTPLGTKTIALYDAFHPVGDASYAKDDDGHGSEVAGVAAAAGVSAGAIGVAPAATVVSVKVLDSKGNGDDTQILAGINAVLASVASGDPYKIRVANFSLGGYDSSASGSAAVPPQPCDDPFVWPLVDAFQQLVNANVVPVVAAGNGGCTNGVAWPACISTSLAVGAVYDASVTGGIQYTDAQQCNGSNGCSDYVTGVGQVACFSDSGAKLDVWAPTCAIAPLMGGGYDNGLFCGTSASAPFASGMVALLSQAVPTASAATIRDALKNSGMPITDARNSITRNLILADQAIGQLQCVTLTVPAGLASNKPSICLGEQFVVSWGSVSGASTYTVQMATEPTFASPTSTTTSTTSANFSSTQASAGTLYLRVRANSSCTGPSDWSSAIQVSYTPSCQTTYAYTYFVSGVARTPGFAPAFWYSDLTVLNVAAAIAQLRVSFYGSSFHTLAPVALGGHQQITWTDALNTLFGIGQDKGMIVVESTQSLRTYSRTYSQVASGTTVETFGQAYVGMEASEALTSVGVGYLGALRSDGQYRTNLELANVSQTATDVNVLFYNGAGTQVGSLLVTVPPFRWVQKTLALPSGQSSAFAEVHVLAVGARVISFATVVDGTSTDPTGIALWIP
jgi:subtilisin family serine protease